jgi:inositol-pentakisphosphate 2-kinase
MTSMCEGLDASDLNKERLRDAFTSALLPLLTGTPILRILSRLQRTLDVLDIEGLSNLWREAEMSTRINLTSGQPSFTGRKSSLQLPIAPLGVSYFGPCGIPTISDWTEFLDIYLSTSAQLDHSEPVPENLRYYLLAYLLSATFKDCSIIIRIDPSSLKGQTTETVESDRVTVIDLDPKSIHKLRKWEQLDQEIVRAYLGVDKPKKCVDGWLE